jgi:hypothetical protein
VVKKLYYLGLLLLSMNLIGNDVQVPLDLQKPDDYASLGVTRKKHCCCPGPRGIQGQTGPQGPAAIPFTSDNFFAFSTTILNGTGVAGTFTDVTLNVLQQQSGWTTPDGIVYICPSSGVYLVAWSMTTASTTELGATNNAVGIVTLNGTTEAIPGSQMGVSYPSNAINGDGRDMTRPFLVRLTAGDTIQLRFGTTAPSSTSIILTPVGTAPGATEAVSATLGAVKISN